jgi:hypothetical protein
LTLGFFGFGRHWIQELCGYKIVGYIFSNYLHRYRMILYPHFCVKH